MVTVELDPVRVESRLSAGEICCPLCSVGVLGGWGHARARSIVGCRAKVRPRRARCRGCGSTHVLLPVSLLLRRAYLADWVFTALVARARGGGHRTIARDLGVPASTVRGWLRALDGRLESVRGWFTEVAITAGVDVTIPAASGSAWVDALAMVAVATEAFRRRFGAGSVLGAVTAARVVVAASSGRLLAPGWPPHPSGPGATRVAPAAAAAAV